MTTAAKVKPEPLRDCSDGIALIVDSYGGSAREAYRIAMMLRRHCGGFLALVPRLAKSAATLLALGASDVYLGTEGELGPLDAQIPDFERERYLSALDEIQALERLNSAALEQIDQTIWLLRSRMPYKKLDTLLPHVLTFVAQMMTR